MLKTKEDILSQLLRGKTKSFIWYSGPSALDGKPIYGLLYLGLGGNRKLGSIPYTTIIPQDKEEFLQNESVCGKCPFLKSPNSGKRSCYVTYYQILTFKKWREWIDEDTMNKMKDKKIPYIDIFDPEIKNALKPLLKKVILRHGNSGDPLSIPIKYLRQLDSFFADSISYTHQAYLYKSKVQEGFQSMISTHSYSHAKALHKNGFRTARVIKGEDSELLPNEIICPEQLGKVLNCDQCRLCGRDNKINIAFIQHGIRKYMNEFPNMT